MRITGLGYGWQISFHQTFANSCLQNCVKNDSKVIFGFKVRWYTWCLPRTLERRVVAHMSGSFHPSLWPSELIFLPSWVLSPFPISLVCIHIMKSTTHTSYYWYWEILFYINFFSSFISKRVDSKTNYYTDTYTHTLHCQSGHFLWP